MDIFSGSHCFRIFALVFFFVVFLLFFLFFGGGVGGTYVKVNLKTLNWIELMQRIIRFSSRIRLS